MAKALKMVNKRMLSDWLSAALQASRKYGRYELRGSRIDRPTEIA